MFLLLTKVICKDRYSISRWTLYCRINNRKRKSTRGRGRRIMEM